jgi:hypothetical protein
LVNVGVCQRQSIRKLLLGESFIGTNSQQDGKLTAVESVTAKCGSQQSLGSREEALQIYPSHNCRMGRVANSR